MGLSESFGAKRKSRSISLHRSSTALGVTPRPHGWPYFALSWLPLRSGSSLQIASRKDYKEAKEKREEKGATAIAMNGLRIPT